MKGIVYNKKSPNVLEIADLQKPTPSDEQVLVKIKAASLTCAENYVIHRLLLDQTGTFRLRQGR
jgi:NADPH:quinone reductase-like Zn-dependent oxidoreductase